MAISRPKGQSKREAAAAKVGGKLDYKTGKISVPVKAPVKKVTDYSMNPEDAPQTTAQFESRIASGLGNPAQVQAAKNEAKLSSSPSKQKEASNRMKAAKPVNTIDFSKVTLKDGGSAGSTAGKIFTGATNMAKSISPVANTLSKLLNMSGVDLSNALGINTARASTGMAVPTDETGQVLGVEDQNIFNDFRKNPTEDINGFAEDAKRTSLANDIFRTEGFRAASGVINGGTNGSSPIRTPRQTVNQPTQQTQPAQQIDLSQIMPILKLLQDNTPVDNGQSGTRRQFLGNGMLGNGLASNGKLDSGIEGLSYGAPMDQEENLINQLLGIKTAQAQEIPQQFSFGNNITPDSAFQNSFANGGLTLDQGYAMPQQFRQGTLNPTIADTQARTTRKETTTPKPTNTAAQFAQGATGGNSTANPMLDYQKQSLKGFSAQEKAQKKALDELIKSIKNQYGTKQTEGLNQLNTSKQEDLLKLSGLFSFANQDPNSEQRIQYEQRANQDYAGQQTDFLAKLAAAMQGDISQANQGYQGKLADINSQRNTAQYNIAQLLQKAKEDALDRASKGGAKSYGTSLDEIMRTQGVDATTARKIYDRQNGLVSEKNPVPSGEFRLDPQTNTLKQLYIVEGQLGFLD